MGRCSPSIYQNMEIIGNLGIFEDIGYNCHLVYTFRKHFNATFKTQTKSLDLNQSISQ